MKTAYLYIRVSTDEQKRKGFSLPEQEDRLVKHCEENGIVIRGVFREDYSAKDFNRPEWKKLISTLKRNRHRPPENILFIKWDRFSRNIEFAYQMLGILRGLNTVPMAIDQPINFDVPESIVMLAVYLSIPEAENIRRGKNCSDGIRRARKMGRLPGRAPMGYLNVSSDDGKKTIVPKQPEADLIKLAFRLYAEGIFSVSQVRKIVGQEGFSCSKNNFWKILHNPTYCGIVIVKAFKEEEQQSVKALHEPLISEELFQKVQWLLTSKRRIKKKKISLISIFPLRGIIICPYCKRILTGSSSSGRSASYRYYHCSTSKCKGRFRADSLETNYEQELKHIYIASAVYHLFNLVLEDENIFSARRRLLDEKSMIIAEIARQKELLSFARKSVVTRNIDFEDFIDLKSTYKEDINTLNYRLENVDQNLKLCEIENKQVLSFTELSVFEIYKKLDILGKRFMASIFTPFIDPVKKNFCSLNIDHDIRKILKLGSEKLPQTFVPIKIVKKNNTPRRFAERKVSVDQAIRSLNKSGIRVDENQASTILDFLYNCAGSFSKENERNKFS